MTSRAEYNWYKVGNRADFIALDIPSLDQEVFLEDVGLVTVSLYNSGSGISLKYDDVFLRAFLNDKNEFYFDDHAIFILENEDIALGIKIEE
jgi:hypothetical protein